MQIFRTVWSLCKLSLDDKLCLRDEIFFAFTSISSASLAVVSRHRVLDSIGVLAST